MMNAAISVRELAKTFRVPVRDAGLAAATRSLFRRQFRDVHAVGGVSFDIAPGEVVGFLGPNGAGKTTTLKMLSGLLHPSSGTAGVLDYVPWKRDRDYLRQMALVMGNRNQLQWDLPVIDSFELNQAIYRIPAQSFQRTQAELVELLDIGELLRKPVRNLSLGERMKVEIVGSLLARPQVLFLDEPTLGLDITMQKRIRTFIAEYNQRQEATVLLTTHYMADVEALCQRVIVIHDGRILYDGSLDVMARRFAAYQVVGMSLASGERLTLRIPKAEAPARIARLLAEQEVTDLTVQDPPIEDVIEQVFAGAPA